MRRVLLKLSGEALAPGAEAGGFGIDPAVLDEMATEIGGLVKAGGQLAVVLVPTDGARAKTPLQVPMAARWRARFARAARLTRYSSSASKILPMCSTTFSPTATSS